MFKARIMSGIAVMSAWAMSPLVVSACERCFGAGVDASAVKAVTSSMFALLIVTVVVFGGVISFFQKIVYNEVELEDGQCRPSSSEPSS